MTDRVGVIDLGSNTTRLLVMEFSPDGSYRVIDEAKQQVRLSEGLEPIGLLQPKAMERTMASLHSFQAVCRLHQVREVLAVATAAVRQAKNGAEFLRRVETEVGFRFRVLSGPEEAWLGYLGMANTLAVEDAILVDVGGASTEVSRIAGRELLESVSLPFGAVTLTERFLTKDPCSAGELRALRAFLQQQWNALPWLKDCRLPVVGIGGTMRAIAKMDRRRRSYRLAQLHNYSVAARDVNLLLRRLRGMNLEQRRAVPGLNRERADIIVGGLVAVDTLLQYARAPRLVASGSGLREGLFYRFFTRVGRGGRLLRAAGFIEALRSGAGEIIVKPAPVVPDVLLHSVHNAMRRLRIDLEQAQRAADLALALFDLTLSRWPEAPEAVRRWLLAAALLHRAGAAVDYYHMSRHTFYLVLHARLNGLSHREIVICAAAAAYRGNGKLKELLQEQGALLLEGDEKVARRLGVLVQLAQALDRAAGGQRVQVQAASSGDGAGLALQVRGGDAGLAADPEVVRWKDELGKVLGESVTLEVAGNV